MGYTADFEGSFALDKPLSKCEMRYLAAFSALRRMKRDPIALKTYDDPIRTDVGLPLGEEGCYFIGDDVDRNGFRGIGVVNHNDPPAGQPGLWCNWIPTSNRQSIVWNGQEKFCNYVEWLQYIVTHFLERWGYTLNGKVDWQGESRDDHGTIVVVNNQISTTTKPRC
jgi:hypothetical protein